MTLYSEGDNFDALFMLSSGSAKSFITTLNGHEQIANFHFPNSLIGLEGFNDMVHAHSLTFLETSSVCRINLQEFYRAMGDSGFVQAQLLKSMSHSIIDEQQLLLSIVQHNAEQRLVKFLLNLSEKYHQNSLSYLVFNLTMTRIDIANYLGMAIETISRLLTKMHSQGIIKVNNRQITLCNIKHLKESLQ
tara:strand:- start:1131 stop:1700 length:570 start_codon:yes stop_codon:yes gene_type:complete